jgi:hypothetical protein
MGLIKLPWFLTRWLTYPIRYAAWSLFRVLLRALRIY